MLQLQETGGSFGCGTGRAGAADTTSAALGAGATGSDRGRVSSITSFWTGAKVDAGAGAGAAGAVPRDTCGAVAKAGADMGRGNSSITSFGAKVTGAGAGAESHTFTAGAGAGAAGVAGAGATGFRVTCGTSPPTAFKLSHPFSRPSFGRWPS